MYNAVFSHNVIKEYGTFDDAIFQCGGSSIIANNLFADNYVFDYYMNQCVIRSSGSSKLINNTIVNNGPGYSYGLAPMAIYCIDGSPIISNNIIANNSAYGIYATEDATPVLTNNCVYGNTEANYYPSTLSHSSDINENPLFTNANNGDYTLQSTSPCIEAGNNDEINSSSIPDFAKSYDLGHNPRIQSGHVDIGAYEYTNVIYVNGASPNAVDDSSHGSSWNYPKKTISGGLATATNGSEIWVAGGANNPYDESVSLKSGVSIYGGFAGTETVREERDWENNVTNIKYVDDNIITATYITRDKIVGLVIGDINT